MMGSMFCLIFGHGKQDMKQDGKGAAWYVCRRCGTVTGSHSWHGGRPWENPHA